MKILERAGRMALFACAVPLLVAEEVRALVSTKGDLAIARERASSAEGERNEAQRSAKNAWLQRDTERSRVVRMHDEIAGRERMVSEAKAEAREARHALASVEADVQTWRKAHADALTAARELQGEVDLARAERDAIAESLSVANGAAHGLTGSLRSAEIELTRIKQCLPLFGP